jgi:hypothetical protein
VAEIGRPQLRRAMTERERDHQDQREGARRQPGQDDLGWLESFEADLDEQKARAPDDSEGGEPDERSSVQGPTSDERTWLRARRRISRLTAFR